MTTSAPSSSGLAPRRPALTHRDAMALAATEYHRMAAVLAALDDDAWGLPTDCPAWHVRQLASHMVGMAAMVSNPVEGARQQRLARAEQATHGGAMVDALTALQVRERADKAPAEIVAEARRVAPRAARGRRWTPSLVRRRTVPEPQLVNGVEEPWTFGYMLDVILTRDPWMHRIDLARATGSDLELTAGHDGVIVDDVVREWAGRHGRPYRLELTGPAGGTWSGGAEVPGLIRMDAVEFCRTVSGRAGGSGLLATEVPF